MSKIITQKNINVNPKKLMHSLIWTKKIVKLQISYLTEKKEGGLTLWRGEEWSRRGRAEGGCRRRRGRRWRGSAPALASLRTPCRAGGWGTTAPPSRAGTANPPPLFLRKSPVPNPFQRVLSLSVSVFVLLLYNLRLSISFFSGFSFFESRCTFLFQWCDSWL